MKPYQMIVARDGNVSDFAAMNGLLAITSRDGVVVREIVKLPMPSGDVMFHANTQQPLTRADALGVAAQHLMRAGECLQSVAAVAPPAPVMTGAPAARAHARSRMAVAKKRARK